MCYRVVVWLHTVGYGLEQKTVYFRMIPLSFSGGSQETNTTEADAAAAFTPAGGPGTVCRQGQHFDFLFLLKTLS